MNITESLRRFGLVPSDSDLPAIRTLLAQEAEAERRGDDREDDLALLCCVQLFSRGLLEDILRIWDAKQSGFDLGCYLDTQLLCGAGLDAAKAFLASQSGDNAANAAAALETIRGCEATGDFDDFSPSKHLEYYRRYFGVHE